MSKHSHKILLKKYPPSEPCSCDICTGYCRRPGWWTVEEAGRAIREGYACRMMLELSPERDFGVLSPAFRGNEGNYALNLFSANGCTFHKNGLCELFGTGHQPLECRYCHHNRKGKGRCCHTDIEKDWCTTDGQDLVKTWIQLMAYNLSSISAIVADASPCRTIKPSLRK